MRKPASRTGAVIGPLIAVSLLLSHGCGGSEDYSPLAWQLDDGRSLAEWVSTQPAAAVFVMDPAECLQCRTVLASWLKERARHDNRFYLLLTRPPDAIELRTFATAGVRADAVIERGGPDPSDTPLELAFEAGRLVYRTSQVRGPQSPLLTRIEQESLEQFVASPPTVAANP